MSDRTITRVVDPSNITTVPNPFGDTSSSQEWNIQPTDESQPYNLDQLQNVPNLSDQTIQNRANRYDYSQGDKSLGVPHYVQSIKTGTEDQDRQAAVYAQNAITDGQREGLIDNFLSTKNPGEVSADDAQFVLGVMNSHDPAYSNPNTIFERAFADRITSDAVALDNYRTYAYAADQGQENHWLETLDANREAITKQMSARKVLEEATGDYEGMSWSQYPVDVGLNLVDALVPFAGWAMHGSGSSLENNIAHLWTLNPDQFEEALRNQVEHYKSIGSPKFAYDYAKAALDYTSTDAFWDNLNVAATAAFGLAPFAKSIAKGSINAATNLKSMLASVGKSVAADPIDTVGVADASSSTMGLTMGVSKSLNPVDQIEQIAKTTGYDAQWRNLTRNLTNIQNPFKYLDGGSQSLASTTAKQALVDMLNNQNSNMLEATVLRPLTVARVDTPEGLQAAVAQARDRFRMMFPSLNNSAIKIDIIPAEKTFNKTDTQVIDIGSGPDQLWDNPKNALNYAKQLGIEDAQVTDKSDLLKTDSGVYVTPTNGRWVIRMYQPVDETTNAIRNTYAKFDLPSGPFGKLINQLPYLAAQRTAKDTLPQEISKWFDVSSAGQQRVLESFQNVWDTWNALPSASSAPKDGVLGIVGKDSRQNFIDYLIRQRDYIDKESNRGLFNNTVSEFEKDWLSQFGKLPSEKETQAYFSYRNLSDMDLVMSSLARLRDKSRLGLSMFKLPFNDKWTEELEGKMLPSLPKTIEHDANVMIWDEDPNKIKFTRLSRINTDKEADLSNYRVLHIHSGWGTQALRDTKDLLRTKQEQVFGPHIPLDEGKVAENQVKQYWDQMLNPGMANDENIKFLDQYFARDISNPDREVTETVPGAHVMDGHGHVDYILFDSDMKNSALPLQQTAFRPGGHVAPQNPWMVSQPNIIRRGIYNKLADHVFMNDINLVNPAKETDAIDYAKTWNQARELLNTWQDNLLKMGTTGVAREKAAQQFVEDHLDVDWTRFKSLYLGSDPRYDRKVPVFHRPINQTTFDARGLAAMTDSNGSPLWDNLRPVWQDEHNLYGGMVNLKWATERGDDLYAVRNEGSRFSPSFARAPYQNIDPLVIAKQAADQLARGRYLDDLKFKAAESFLAKYAPVLDGNIDALRQDPFNALVNAKFKEAVKGGNNALLAEAKNYRNSALRLMNIQSERQDWVGLTKAKVQSMLTENVGERAGSIVENWMPENHGSMYAKIRGVNFDLGKFMNPAQIFVQGTYALHTMAVLGPIKGMQALGGGILLSALKTGADEGFLNGISKLAGVMGYDRDMFKEAYQALERSNWKMVGKSVAELDDYTDTRLWNGFWSGLDKTRDMGRTFFKMGESYSRRAAWMGAFAEWRAANPYKALTDSSIADILYRADTLNGNMTNASAAAWQKNMLSIPMQYQSWSVRLMEQLMPGYSTRLSAKDKITAFMMYSAMFGLPYGLTGAAGGWPIYREIQKYYQRNYSLSLDTDNSTFGQLFNHGLLQTAFYHATGKDYAISDRFGPTGMNIFHDLWYSTERDPNKSLWSVLMGPMHDTLQKAYEASIPYAMWMTSPISGRSYPLTWNDFKQTFETLTVGKKALQAWGSYNTAAYLSRNGTNLLGLNHPMDSSDALFQGLIGVVPQDLSNAETASEGNKDIEGHMDQAGKMYIDNKRLAMKAMSEGNYDLSKDFMTRAKTWWVIGGFDHYPQKAYDLEKKLGAGNAGFLPRVQQNFYNLNSDTQRELINGAKQ